jgi:hypothetical protein
MFHLINMFGCVLAKLGEWYRFHALPPLIYIMALFQPGRQGTDKGGHRPPMLPVCNSATVHKAKHPDGGVKKKWNSFITQGFNKKAMGQMGYLKEGLKKIALLI